MITVTEHALIAMHFNPESPLAAVQSVRSRIMKDDSTVNEGEGVQLINKLLGLNIDPKMFRTDAVDVKGDLLDDYELMVTQAVTEVVVKNVGVPVDEAEVLANAKSRAVRLLNSPQHKWMFAKPQATASGMATTEVAVSTSVDVKVAVKADGKIKKGGKEVLAIALYQKYVADLGDKPYENQAFIAILSKELGMSKPGATTYNYNCKKRFGGQITPKAKK